MPAPAAIAPPLLAWYDRHGRKGLPWKEAATPYRVWVSEVMLQQTRVVTVLDYFPRFVARFPDVAALAAAAEDQVLHLWSGLGYYSRARNLHRAAQEMVARHGGELPPERAALERLPGIGRSTAAAILALSAGRREAILDGNAKRVLARYHALEGWPGEAAVTARLWELAERHTPAERVADYTQAIMDLGATLCARGQPACGACPLAAGCLGYQRGIAARLPAPRPRRELPVRTVRWLLLRDAGGRVLLLRRPPSGVWGGLWCFPECPPEADAAEWCRERLGLAVRPEAPLAPFRHTFSHFHLDVAPLPCTVTGSGGSVMAAPPALWYNSRDAETVGLAAPVQRILNEITQIMEAD